MPTPDTFDAGAKAAANIILQRSIALTGNGATGQAVGQAPATVPFTVLGDLYIEIMNLKGDTK